MRIATNLLILTMVLVAVLVGFIPAVLGFLVRCIWCGFVVGGQIFDEALER